MPAIDTNVLVRLLVADDAGQTRAAEAFIKNGAWVSQLVLVEALWVASAYYGRSAKQIESSVEKLLSNTELILQEPDLIAAALELFRKRPSIGFSDCLILETARKAGWLPLGTFDRALGKIDGAVSLQRKSK